MKAHQTNARHPARCDLTLDGEEITVDSLKDKIGEAVLTVAYQTNEPLPALAVTVLPLPEEGVTDLRWKMPLRSPSWAVRCWWAGPCPA